MELRKTLLQQETLVAEAGRAAANAITRVCGIAVFKNPFAGAGYVEDLSPLFEIGGQLAEQISADAVSRLDRPPVSYGKVAVVGTLGDFEHGSAVIHPKLGKPMRAAIGGGKALIPSNVKVAGPGAPVDIPLGHKDDLWSFDHFDTITVCVPDSPRPDEIMLLIAFADGGRVNPRSGQAPITS